ncbi:MAG: DUF4779 domain-containing protein [Myxococcales bacterium]|nr:DUF4779 domain-containing protein [Myxococcales bacterium]
MASSELLGGTVDSGNSPKYPGVVGVWRTGGGIATGTVLSRTVVVTAGHLAADMLSGCRPFSYYRSGHDDEGNQLRVNLGDANGLVFQGSGDEYRVDAIAGLRRYTPSNAYDCCGQAGALCDACNIQTDGSYAAGLARISAFDFVLLHLDRPLPLASPRPMNFVARITNGYTDATTHAYPIHPETWAGTVVATAVGGGFYGPNLGDFGQRKYGSTAILDLGVPAELPAPFLPWHWDVVAGADRCDSSWLSQPPPTTEEFTCDRCTLLVGNQSPLLPPDAPIGQGGDSGGPLVVNDWRSGATRIEGLPLDPDFSNPARGAPVVVGFGAPGLVIGDFVPSAIAVTWDSPLPGGDVAESGTFILKHLNDWDQDGVVDAFDNCVFTPNADQANCNDDAEQKYGFTPRGDTCDPVPCANVAVGAKVVKTEIVDGIQYGRGVHAKLEIRPSGSHFTMSGLQNHVPLDDVSVGSVRTEYRFCQSNDAVSPPVECLDPAVIDKNHATDAEPVQPDAARPWMRVRMRVPGPICLNCPPPFTEELLYHPKAAQHRDWLYFDDYQRWVQSGAITAPGCDPVLGCDCQSVYHCGTNLDGRFWVHSDTPKGRFTDQVPSPYSFDPFYPPTTGFDDINGAQSPLDEQLSSHYEPLAPDPPYAAKLPHPVPFASPSWIYRVPRRPGVDPPGWDAPHGEASYVLPVDGGGYGLLRTGGEALAVTELLGANLRALLATPGIVWAPAVEAHLTVSLGAAADGFHALAFAADGTDVVEGVLRDGLLAGTTADFARVPPTRAGSPSPRHDFAGVFSRAEDRAFVVGGVEDATSELAGDIWYRAVEGEGEWQEAPLGDFRVGTVLAATWSYVDHRLWVLDEVPAEPEHGAHGTEEHAGHADDHGHASHGGHDDNGDHGDCEHGGHAGHGDEHHGGHDAHGAATGHASRARLYRVEPYLGVVQLVGDWARHPSFDRHWLALDIDGQVLLVASSAHAHAIAKLEATAYDALAPLRVSFRHRPKGLVLPPIVDELGYSFARRGPGGAVVLERVAELGLHASPLSDLAGAL